MFDNIVSRRNTNCAKWDELIEECKIEDIISLTVADMDFKVAPEIISSVIDAANHGIYGYTNVSEKYIELSRQWIERKYHWSLKEDWIVYCPRVIQAISLLIQNCTNKGDKIMVSTPLYDPIQNAVRVNDRCLVTNSLILKDNHYEIDFDDFENKIKDGVKIYIAVSPHNPVGRVWREDEISRIVDICKKHKVLIIADEVHADFIWENQFVSFGLFFDKYDDIIIGTSASKTFNIPGLEASNIIIKNEERRDFFKKLLRQAGIHNPSYFCIPAVEAAYEYGEEWLNLAKDTIKGNLDFTRNFFENEMTGYKVINSEGTYMLWVDYKDTGIKEEKLRDLMINKAKVAFSLGSGFGNEGEGFFRVNVAQPRKLLEEALLRYKNNIDWEEENERTN